MARRGELESGRDCGQTDSQSTAVELMIKFKSVRCFSTHTHTHRVCTFSTRLPGNRTHPHSHTSMVIIYYAPNHGKCIKILVYTGKVWPKMSELERYGHVAAWMPCNCMEWDVGTSVLRCSVCQISLRE